MGHHSLTVFYDGGCTLCSREVRHYMRLDQGHQIDWIDISSTPHRLADYDLTFETAMYDLHVVKNDGEILSGVAAFIAIWTTLSQYRWLAALCELLPVRRSLELAYPVFARWRLGRRCTTASCSDFPANTNDR